MKAKFEAVAIVTHVKNNPGIDYDNLKSLFDVSQAENKKFYQMLYYCTDQKFLQIKVVDGQKCYFLGANEVWLAQHDLLPEANPKESTASGVATTQLVSEAMPSEQQCNSGEQEAHYSPHLHSATPGAESTASPAGSTLEPLPAKVEDIPSFLASASQLPPEVEEAEHVAIEAVTGDISEYGRFRLAYTDEGELMIFGVTYAPVELTTMQTCRLMQFLGSDYMKKLKI
jgi:hypothetical protein